jgi:hypothetical protein
MIETQKAISIIRWIFHFLVIFMSVAILFINTPELIRNNPGYPLLDGAVNVISYLFVILSFLLRGIFRSLILLSSLSFLVGRLTQAIINGLQDDREVGMYYTIDNLFSPVGFFLMIFMICIIIEIIYAIRFYRPNAVK